MELDVLSLYVLQVQVSSLIVTIKHVGNINNIKIELNISFNKY